MLFISAEAESPAGYYLMKMWDPIEKLFNKQHNFNEYGNQIQSVCLVFICTSDALISSGFYPERKRISHIQKTADYRIRIPYLPFIKGNDSVRWELTIDAISRALNDIQRKIPYFDAKKLLNDIELARNCIRTGTDLY